MKRCCLLLGLLLIFTIICSCSKPAADTGFDWPQWRGPDGNRQSRETEWDPTSIANPKILWKADIGTGYSNVVVQAGRLYATGMKTGRLLVFCFNAATGRRIWQKSFITYSAPRSAPAVAGNWLFVLTAEGYLYGIDSRTGAQRWRKDLVADFGAVKPFYSFGGAPVVEGDLVLFSANTTGMAVKRDTGKLAWTSSQPPKDFISASRMYSTGTSYATPVAYDGPTGRQAILAGWTGLTSVDVRTGTPSWHFGWDIEPGGCSVDPIIAGTTVCMALAFELPLNVSGFLLGIDGNEPKILWRTSELCAGIGYPILIGDCLYSMYGGPSNGFTSQLPASLRCYELGSGRVLWEERFGSYREKKSISLASANGILILLDDQGVLYTAEASSGGYTEIARCDVLLGAAKPRLFWTPPMLCSAKIYCRNYAGDLVCIDVSK